MIGFFTKSIRILSVSVAILSAASASVSAMERQFADDNCAINVPDTWHDVTDKMPIPGLIVAFSDVTGKKIVYLQRIPEKPTAPLNDGSIAELEKGIEESGGGEKVSGKYIEVGGMKSYERLGTLLAKGKHVSTLTRFVPGENNYYNVQALRFDLDVNQDGEILEVMDSFRFLRPFTPTYAPAFDSAAYQFGKTMGHLLVVILVVGFIVYVLRSAFSNRQSPRPPSRPPPARPPPLPPGA